MLNLGVRGRAPGVTFFRDARFQRIYASLTVTVILPRGELFQIPLVAIFVVVVHPIGDNSLNLLIGVTRALLTHNIGHRKYFLAEGILKEL